MSPTTHIAYLGHSTLRLDVDGVRFLTDPVLRSRIGPLIRQGRPLEPGDYGGTDVVLVSHLHRDHLDLGSLRLLGQPKVVVPRGAGEFLRSHGFHDVVELAAGDEAQVGTTTIRATHARHSGSRPPLGPRAEAVGYLLETAHDRLYFAGDTDLFPGMADLGAPDIAFLPVWGWGPTLGSGHLDPERAARAAGLVRPRLAVPIHWGTFWPRGLGRLRSHRLSGPAAEFARDVAELAPGVAVSPTVPGDLVSVRRAHHMPS